MTPPKSTTISDLEDQHPGWSIWRSTGSPGLPGAYYASRRRPLTRAEFEALVPATLAADSLDELAALLDGDRHREAM
ncbi:MAG: hypothetical protein JWO67_2886 [Streptosporangiaceae bacterium]|nr:hypothetical protein [Streptosporangiaceae bacterium]